MLTLSRKREKYVVHGSIATRVNDSFWPVAACHEGLFATQSSPKIKAQDRELLSFYRDRWRKGPIRATQRVDRWLVAITYEVGQGCNL